MLKVTCAIIQKEDKVLICQRSEAMKLPLKWEFPGGKIEENESKQACLKREIQEELGIEVHVLEELSSVEYQYPDFSICLYPFLCSISNGNIKAKEHAQVKWVAIPELKQYDWAEADLPIVDELVVLLEAKSL